MASMPDSPVPSDPNYPRFRKRARIEGIIDWERTQGRNGFHEAVFRFEGLSHSQGWKLLSGERTLKDPSLPETRGRPAKFTADDMHIIEEQIREHGWTSKSIGWDELSKECLGKEVSAATLRREIQTLDYYRCVFCNRYYMNAELTRERVEYCHATLAQRPLPENWEPVRFCEEVHATWGPNGESRVFRRPGERVCRDCIKVQGQEGPEKRRVHGWAAAGLNFKTKFTMYDQLDQGNYICKMGVKTYTNNILEPIIKPWLQAGHQFVLEEDRAYGIGVNSELRKWKRNNGLQYYFNNPFSPDLAPLENAWKPPKYHPVKYQTWDEQFAKDLVTEGWDDHLHQEFINYRVYTMPQRLQRVIETDGELAIM